MQNYIEIPSSETVSAARAKLLNNDKTIMSCHSGTTAPTANLQIGMLFLNTSTNILYQLKDLTPTWIAIADLSKTITDKSYVDTELALKANLSSPALSGTPTAPTAAVGTNTTQVATTAFVNAEIANDAPTKTGGGASGSWGISITGSSASCTGNAATATTANNIPTVDVGGNLWIA